VDDEVSQLRTGRRVLTQLGYQVDTVASGAQALDIFRQVAANTAEAARAPGESPYDLVIFDMVLDEECDGLLFSERVRQLFPGQRIIIASGHAPTERVEAALREGLIWLAKPYTADALGRAVRNACRGS
jgi:CheY-like chemotaxis protein